MQSSTLFSFLTLEVDHETDTEVSFPTRSMILNGKLRFYVLDEASKKRELIAKSYIILKGDLQVEFWKKAQSIIYSLRTITVECCIKL